VQSALVAVFLTTRNLRSKKLGACLVIGNRKVTSQGLQLAALRSQVHQTSPHRVYNTQSSVGLPVGHFCNVANSARVIVLHGLLRSLCPSQREILSFYNCDFLGTSWTTIKRLLKPTSDRYDLRETFAGADALSQEAPTPVRGARMTLRRVGQTNHGVADQYQVFTVDL